MIPYDKCLHMLAGIAVYALAHLFLVWWIALIIVAAVATGKEVYDYLNPKTHTPDVMDAVYTLAGGVMGLVCSVSVL